MAKLGTSPTSPTEKEPIYTAEPLPKKAKGNGSIESRVSKCKAKTECKTGWILTKEQLNLHIPAPNSWLPNTNSHFLGLASEGPLMMGPFTHGTLRCPALLHSPQTVKAPAHTLLARDLKTFLRVADQPNKKKTTWRKQPLNKEKKNWKILRVKRRYCILRTSEEPY